VAALVVFGVFVTVLAVVVALPVFGFFTLGGG
jgi:hypothetical protein